MKKVIYVFLAMIVLSACSLKTKKIIETTHTDGSPKTVSYYKILGDDSVLIKQIFYYPNHQKRVEGSYKNNKREGKWTYWYKNGNKWSEGYFKNGLSDGKRDIWYENGKRYYEAFYKDGERVGKWRFYDENGKFIKEVIYGEK